MPYQDPGHNKERLAELCELARALTATGHGVVSGRPANLGSKMWADAAWNLLKELGGEQ